MLPSNKRSIIALFALLFICIANAKAQNIEVAFTGIKSPKGQIVVKIFTDDKSFQDDKHFKLVKFTKHDIVNGEMTEKLSLDPGVYGFALVDDENNSGTMESNIVGMPKEGFGFSNFYLTGLRKPKFDEFKFVLNKNQKQKINMKIRYL